MEIDEAIQTIRDNMDDVVRATFDGNSRHWTEDHDLNRLFLKAQENYAGMVLEARGHILVNDVFDSLGIPRTALGATVGWTVGGRNPVRFNASMYVDGSFSLLFRTDGFILHKI